MWAPTAGALFMSDRNGAEKSGRRRSRRRRRGGDPLHRRPRALADASPTTARRSSFERDFGDLALDVASGRASEVPITLRGATAARASSTCALDAQFGELALSPDGKKVAFSRAARSSPRRRRTAATPARVTDAHRPPSRSSPGRPTAARSSTSSERDGASALCALRLRHARRRRSPPRRERRLRAAVVARRQGIAFLRGGTRAARARRRDRQDARRSPTGSSPAVRASARLAWSPDGRWIAYMASPAARRSPTSSHRRRRRRRAPAGSFLANATAADPWSARRHVPRSSTPASAPSPRRSRASTSCRARRASARTSSATSSTGDAEQPAGSHASAAAAGPADADSPPRTEDVRHARTAPIRGHARQPPATPVEIVFDDIRRRLSPAAGRPRRRTSGRSAPTARRCCSSPAPRGREPVHVFARRAGRERRSRAS